MEPVKSPEHDAALNSCEDEQQGRLTALAKLYVRDENLQYNPSLKQHEHLLLTWDGTKQYMEYARKAHILSFNDDTTNRDTGGNLIARRDPNVDRDGWQPHSPACPKSRKGMMVDSADLGVPGSPKSPE